MAWTVAGSEGTGTATCTAATVAQKTIFTTPATSNAVFLVEVSLSGGGGWLEFNQGGGVDGIPTATISDPVNGDVVTFRAIYGPSTAVKVRARNNHATVDQTLTFDYNYTSIVVA